MLVAAPLSLTRNTIAVAVHLCIGTVLNEVGGLSAGGHLGAVRTAIAFEGGRCSRRCCDRLRVAAYGLHNRLGLVLAVAPVGQGSK